MATARMIDNLVSDLRKKYFAKSDEAIVAFDIINDINQYKKYEILKPHEALDVVKQAVCCTDGYDSWEHITNTMTIEEICWSWFGYC